MGGGALVLILCMQLGLLGGEETHEYRDAGSVWRRKDPWTWWLGRKAHTCGVTPARTSRVEDRTESMGNGPKHLHCFSVALGVVCAPGYKYCRQALYIYTHARTHTNTHTHARTHARARARARTHTRTHAHHPLLDYSRLPGLCLEELASKYFCQL